MVVVPPCGVVAVVLIPLVSGVLVVVVSSADVGDGLGDVVDGDSAILSNVAMLTTPVASCCCSSSFACRLAFALVAESFVAHALEWHSLPNLSFAFVVPGVVGLVLAIALSFVVALSFSFLVVFSFALSFVLALVLSFVDCIDIHWCRSSSIVGCHC